MIRRWPPFGTCPDDFAYFLGLRAAHPARVHWPLGGAIALVPYGTYSYQIAANSPDGSQQLISPDLGNHVPAYGFSVYTTYDYVAGGTETAGAGISFGLVIDGDQVGVPDKFNNRGDIGFSSLVSANTVDWSPIGCMPPAGSGSQLQEIYNFSTGHGPLVSPGEFSPGPWTTPLPYQMAIEFQRANLTGAKNTCGFVGAGGQGGADGGRTKKSTGTLNFANALTPVSVTGLGFTPDFVVLIQQADWKNGFTRTGHDAKISIGIAVNDGSNTQRSLSYGEQTGQVSGTPRQWLSTTNALVVQDPASAALLFSAQVNSFDAGGFTMTPTFISAGETRAYFCGFLAVKLHGAKCALVDYTTPAVTGNQATTGLGFKPGFGLAVMSGLTLANSSVQSNDAGGLSISLFDASTQWAGGVRIQSGASPTNTAGFRSQNAMRVATGVNSQASLASFVSFDAGGFTLDWSTVDGAARKGFVLAIGNELAK